MAPPGFGTPLDLAYFGHDSNPTPTSFIDFDAYFTDHHEVGGEISAFEAQEAVLAFNPALFDDILIATGENVSSLYQLWDFRATYRYNINPGDRVVASLGAAVDVQDWGARLKTNTGKKATLYVFQVFPLPYLRDDARLSERIHSVAEASGVSLGNDWTADARGALKWQVDRTWDIGLGYRWTLRGFDYGDVRTRLQLHTIYVSFGFSFGERGGAS